MTRLRAIRKKMNLLPGGTQPVPVYVTRKSASGETGTYTFSIAWSLAVMLLGYFNAALWGIYGLIQAVTHIL